jgi:ribosomal protein S18 acetylase RimI-like enzyme
MTTTVKKATAGDIPALVELMREFYAESHYHLDGGWAAAAFSALLGDDSRGAAWLVSRGGGPAGYVVLTVRFSMEYGGLDAFVDDLFVRPAHRRRGLGRAALDALFAECGRRGVLAAHVEVGRDNAAAKSLYRSYGFDVHDAGREVLTVRLGAGGA